MATKETILYDYRVIRIVKEIYYVVKAANRKEVKLRIEDPVSITVVSESITKVKK